MKNNVETKYYKISQRNVHFSNLNEIDEKADSDRLKNRVKFSCGLSSENILSG